MSGSLDVVYSLLCVSGVDVWSTGCCVQFAVCVCLVLMSGSLDVMYSLLCVSGVDV